jgi:HlyD family secretion protein
MQKISSNQKKSFATFIIVSVFSSIFWSFHAHSATNKTDPTSPVVKTTITKEADQSSSLEISGFVRGGNRANITPLASGRILKIFKQEGESVKLGEIIAIIDTSQIDAQISATNSNISELEKTLQDSEKYYNQLVKEAKSADSNADTNASKEALKSAKRARDLQIQATRDQLVSAQGALKIAQAGKKDFSIAAPFPGKITAVHDRVGGFANFGTPLFDISSENNFEVEVHVSATLGHQISIGNTATFNTKNNTSIIGIVSVVSPGADTQTLKTLVRVKLNDLPETINLGDFLHGEIILPHENNVISIPSSAVVSRGGDPIVFIVDENNIAKEKSVKLGNLQNGMVDVLDGLSQNQKIVIEGQQYLVNGLSVKENGTK